MLVALAVSASDTPRTEESKLVYRRAMEVADRKISEEVSLHSELISSLEYLSDHIGPRLTGSPQLQQANVWALGRFREYGIDAHLESTELPHAWTRGTEVAEIISPISRRIEVHAAGWSKATAGEIVAQVVTLDSGAIGIAPYEGRLKGAVVMQPPRSVPPRDWLPENSYDAVAIPARVVPGANLGASWLELIKQLAPEGAAAFLLDSAKTDNLFGMGAFTRYEPSELPILILNHEDYALIYRLAKSGPVALKFAIGGSFSSGPVSVSDTVAEIKGYEFPDERVIIGAHLDSWDLGTGALDNGTGAMAVLEASRALKALGWKPKRTLTFVLFAGEEEGGGVGAKLFVTNHVAEIRKIDAVLVHDAGTGKVITIALDHLYETGPLMEEIFEPLEIVFDLQPLSTRYIGSSDHVLFLEQGVPAYFCIQKAAKYGEVHHSQTDTFDKVVPDEINEGAAFMAAWAWNVSEMPDPLPQHVPWHDRH